MSTVSIYMWSVAAPELRTYAVTKSASTALFQRIAQDVSPDELQIVSYHPGSVYTDQMRKIGLEEDFADFDDGMCPPSSIYNKIEARRKLSWKC